jgi:hypothetical protein
MINLPAFLALHNSEENGKCPLDHEGYSQPLFVMENLRTASPENK